MNKTKRLAYKTAGYKEWDKLSKRAKETAKRKWPPPYEGYLYQMNLSRLPKKFLEGPYRRVCK